MVFRAVAVVLVAGLLGGCTDADWDHALSYAGLDTSSPPPPALSDEPAQPATVTAQAAPAAGEWCAEVARAARAEAAGDGFDLPTQEHRAQVAFAQCQRGGSDMQ